MSKDKRQWPSRVGIVFFNDGSAEVRLDGLPPSEIYLSENDHFHLLQQKDAAIAKLREALKKCADPWCSEFPKEVADKALKETEGV